MRLSRAFLGGRPVPSSQDHLLPTPHSNSNLARSYQQIPDIQHRAAVQVAGIWGGNGTLFTEQLHDSRVFRKLGQCGSKKRAVLVVLDR